MKVLIALFLLGVVSFFATNINAAEMRPVRGGPAQLPAFCADGATSGDDIHHNLTEMSGFTLMFERTNKQKDTVRLYENMHDGRWMLLKVMPTGSCFVAIGERDMGT